jgi:hypothetical protein
MEGEDDGILDKEGILLGCLHEILSVKSMCTLLAKTNEERRMKFVSLPLLMGNCSH